MVNDALFFSGRVYPQRYFSFAPSIQKHRIICTGSHAKQGCCEEPRQKTTLSYCPTVVGPEFCASVTSVSAPATSLTPLDGHHARAPAPTTTTFPVTQHNYIDPGPPNHPNSENPTSKQEHLSHGLPRRHPRPRAHCTPHVAMKQSKGKGKTTAGGFGSGATAFGGFGSSEGRSTLSYLAEPPSFAGIADPHVVVSFKNVLKKDSTTKAKGLEELISHTQAHPFDKDGGVEEALLGVWVQIYPRVSIDNSRRVRELSHNLQFELVKSARKRMEKHIPTIVGAWLAGLYDRDRVVSRAANHGLSSFLSTPEKTLGFWKKCHNQILDYAIDGIQETQDTLSDERSTTKEDAEAKYFRVVTASLSLVLSLLQKMPDDDIAKLESRYADFFAEETVWKSITFSDSSVRKTVCQLLFACLDRKLPYAEGTKVKQAFVTGGLRTNQTGSALEYVRALTKLTQSNPDVWASSGEKKSPMTRLQAFVAKGSQGSQPRFWECLDQLLNLIPTDTLTLEDASSLLSSVKSGVTSREEPRTNTSLAWKCYIDTARRLLGALESEDQLAFGRNHLFPLFEQFLFTVSDTPTAVPTGPNAMAILVDVYAITSVAKAPLASAVGDEWDRLASILCGNILASLPAVSKEFQVSQEKIGEEGRRWFAIVGHIHQKITESNGDVPDYTTEPSSKIISQSLSILENRNLKPFGAARIIEYALSTSAHLFRGDKWKAITAFFRLAAENDMAKVIDSPSYRYLLSSVNILGSFPDSEENYSRLWRGWVDGAMRPESAQARDDILASLISNEKGSKLAKETKTLQDAVLSQTIATTQGQADAWELLQQAVTYGVLDDATYRSLSQDLVKSLDKNDGHSDKVLRALEVLVKGRPQLFSTSEDLHTALVAQLLSLSEITESSVSSQAASIRVLLDTHSDGKLPVVGIIQSNLDRAGPQSLEYVSPPPASLAHVLTQVVSKRSRPKLELLRMYRWKTSSLTPIYGWRSCPTSSKSQSTPHYLSPAILAVPDPW